MRLVQSLLSKSWSDYSISDNTTVIRWWSSWNAYNTTYNVTIWTITPTVKAVYTFSWSHYHNSQIRVDWVAVTTHNNSTDDTDTVSWTMTLYPWNTYTVTAYATSSSGYWYSSVSWITVKRTTILASKDWLNWIPVEVKNIWEIWFIQYFWIIDEELYIWKEVNTASAWSITLWKAVWYLKIWKYRIPYYN